MNCDGMSLDHGITARFSFENKSVTAKDREQARRTNAHQIWYRVEVDVTLSINAKI